MGSSSTRASLHAELNATTQRLHTLVDAIEETSWRTPPAQGRWSVAECVEHLNMTSRAYIPLLGDALRDGRARGLTNAGGSNRMDLMGWFLAKMLEPPVKRMRVTTSEPFATPSVVPRADAVAEYEALQRTLIGILDQADGLALSKIKLASPFNAKMRYSVYSAYRVIAAHQRRHLWQAEQAREAVRTVPR
jgi:hypothetical protein